MQITAADLSIMRGMTPEQRREYITAKSGRGAQAPQSRTFMPTSKADGTHIGGRYSTYVADSPLKHLANAFATGKNIKTMKANDQARADALATREAAGGKLADAVADADLNQLGSSGFTHIGNGVFMDPVTGQEVTSPAWSAGKDKAHEQALERIAANVRVPASVKTDLADTETKISFGDQVIADLEGTEGAFSIPKDLAIEFAGTLHPSLASVGRELLYNTDQQGAREGTSKWVEDMRRKLTGANLTAMESVLGQQWDPSQAGISQETAVRRMTALNDYLKANHANMLGQFGAGGDQPGPAAANDLSTPPGPELIDTGAQPMRITRGGVTYVSTDGGASWVPE